MQTIGQYSFTSRDDVWLEESSFGRTMVKFHMSWGGARRFEGHVMSQSGILIVACS